MWFRITRSDFLGYLFLTLGVGIFLGHWWAERKMNLDHIMSGIAFASLLIGAALLSPDTMVTALKNLAGALGSLLPWKKGE